MAIDATLEPLEQRLVDTIKTVADAGAVHSDKLGGEDDIDVISDLKGRGFVLRLQGGPGAPGTSAGAVVEEYTWSVFGAREYRDWGAEFDSWKGTCVQVRRAVLRNATLIDPELIGTEDEDEAPGLGLVSTFEWFAIDRYVEAAEAKTKLPHFCALGQVTVRVLTYC